MARHRLAATPDAPAHARRLVADALGRDDEVAAAQLAVSEIVTNAVRYGRTRPGRREIELRIECCGPRMRVSVLDPGAGPEPRRRPGGACGGWGLEIVDRVVHAWGHDREHGRTLVWFEV